MITYLELVEVFELRPLSSVLFKVSKTIPYHPTGDIIVSAVGWVVDAIVKPQPGVSFGGIGLAPGVRNIEVPVNVSKRDSLCGFHFRSLC
jgi:hypothetical protein